MTSDDDIQRNSVVLLNLVNPKEKFWGVVRSVTQVGVTLRGINIEAFEDWVRQLGRGEDQTLDLVTMFVPLFRVERMFLDEAVGPVPSYSQLFEEVVGMSPLKYLGFEEIDPGEVS